jgi:hypothetical protein
MGATETVAYDLDGSLLEVCTCDVLCPCWIGEDPDGGDCKSVVAYHFDRGTIRGVDVGGLTLVAAVYIPGNILAGNMRQVLFVDDRASEEQEAAMLDAFTGKLGGPLADLASLVSDRREVRRAPIVHEIADGAGRLLVGDVIECEAHPYRGPDGTATTLHNSIFSTVPGSPAYVGVADKQRVEIPEHDLVWSAEARNAIQSDWKLVHAEGT